MSLSALERVRAALGAVLVGREDAATGLMLAWLAREHAYLEGPPGCGKSALARALAELLGARCAEFAFHRDAGAAELLGELALRSERPPTRPGHPGAASERLRLWRADGPLLHAQLLLLEDLSRAPGEALGPLLHVLGERRLGERALPLETAIASAGPPDLESYADPLEPAQLDRFAIQLRLHGLLGARRFAQARELLERPPAPEGPLEPVLTADERRELQQRAAALPIEPGTRRALLAALGRLREAAGDAALLSDRVFARAAPAVLRAHALLRGAQAAQPQDVRALRYMLARRVPEALEPHLDALLDDALLGAELASAAPAAVRSTARASAEAGGGAADSAAPSVPLQTVHAPLESVLPQAAARGADDAASVEALVRALGGRLERGAAERGDDPGGSPRGWRRMRGLDELLDADPLEALLFAQGRAPAGVRVCRRQRRASGGALALLRDVSASMEGRLARWAGEVVAGLVRSGARRRMRIGYVEFNHEAERFASGGHFFHRRYRRLLALAARRRAEGRTSYEAPLRAALAEFRGAGAGARARHIVLLTDGVPVLGDPTVLRERALALELGVRVHTVFLGMGECPAVLDEISRETDGLRFAARLRPDGGVVVRERVLARRAGGPA